MDKRTKLKSKSTEPKKQAMSDTTEDMKSNSNKKNIPSGISQKQ